MLNTKLNLDLSKLEQLAPRLQKNAYKKALRAGAKLALADLRSAVPVASGALKKSLSSKVDSPKGETSAIAVIGPRSSFTVTKNGRLKKPSRYFHFLETGKFARPTIYPTYQHGESKYMDAIVAVLKAEIEKAMQ